LPERVFREEWGRVLASLVGFLGDFDPAEEAAQEAFAVAGERWPAHNRAIDRLRRDRVLAAETRLLQVPEAVEDVIEQTSFPDERLQLIFTCCHPALGLEVQVALTLRALGGLTTEEIARAFVVPEQTMKRRLSRRNARSKTPASPSASPPST
jgi:RNA polymerase sigma-70 factor (ECF subfamily)